MMKLVCFILLPTLCLSQTAIDNAKLYLSEKEFVKAQQEMTAFLEENSEDKEAIELLGDAYGHQEKWDQAIAQYEKLKDREPNNANYQYKYGGALGMKALTISKLKALGIIGDVKKAFLKAAALNPKHIDARWALVELYVSLPGVVGGSISKALNYANELQDLSAVDGYLAKGYIYENDDEPELAEKYYKLAIKVGGSVNCYEKLTTFYESHDKADEAIDNIEKAHKQYQRNAMHYQIGKVCADYNIQLDKGEKCLKVYLANYSAKDGVPEAWAYYRLAQIFKHKKNKELALQWIDKAIMSLPKIKVFKAEKVQISKL